MEQSGYEVAGQGASAVQACSLPLPLPCRLVTASFPEGHFSHVFIDECGHAVEPESLVAIAGE